MLPFPPASGGRCLGLLASILSDTWHLCFDNFRDKVKSQRTQMFQAASFPLDISPHKASVQEHGRGGPRSPSLGFTFINPINIKIEYHDFYDCVFFFPSSKQQCPVLGSQLLSLQSSGKDGVLVISSSCNKNPLSLGD